MAPGAVGRNSKRLNGGRAPRVRLSGAGPSPRSPAASLILGPGMPGPVDIRLHLTGCHFHSSSPPTSAIAYFRRLPSSHIAVRFASSTLPRLFRHHGMIYAVVTRLRH